MRTDFSARSQILFINSAVQTELAAFIQGLAVGIGSGSGLLGLGASSAVVVTSAASAAIAVFLALAVRTDNHVAVHVFAFAPGGSAVDLLYRRMNDAALVGVHRL